MAQTPQYQDFPPLPQYSQQTTRQEVWITVVTTRIDPDGTVTQRSQILSKR